MTNYNICAIVTNGSFFNLKLGGTLKKRNSKNKPVARNKGVLLIVGYIFLVLAIVTIGYYLKPTSTAELTPYRAKELRQQLNLICREYMLATTHNNSWWLKTAEEPTLALSNKLENAATKIREGLERAAPASPLATQIASTFTNFVITMYVNGSAIAISKGDMDPKAVSNTIEVCFFPEDQYLKGEIDSSLFYKPNWDAAMIAAIGWPETFFSGVLMHEIGHAHWKRTKGQPPNFTRDWFIDEVTMHELETRVLDHLTSQKYSQKLLEIYNKNSSAPTSADFVAGVDMKDLLDLDQIIGVQDNGHAVRGAAATQHIVQLGFTYIENKQGSLDDKIIHYRWIIGK